MITKVNVSEAEQADTGPVSSLPSNQIRAEIADRTQRGLETKLRTSATIKVYCNPDRHRSLANRFLQLSADEAGLHGTMSPAIKHHIACRPVDQTATVGEPAVMQRAIDKLEPEDMLPETPTPPQVTLKLLPHQMRALSFMMGKETGNLPGDVSIQETQDGIGPPCYQDILSGRMTREPPSHQHGGILADDMGLGKTLQAIALIVSTLDRARLWAASAGGPDESPRRMATLVVAPSNILNV